MDKLSNIAGLIVVATIVGTIVGSKNTKDQIAALTSGFADVLRATTGKK